MIKTHWLDNLYVEGSSVEETATRLAEAPELKKAIEEGIAEEAKDTTPGQEIGLGPGQSLRDAIQAAILGPSD